LPRYDFSCSPCTKERKAKNASGSYSIGEIE
jgi:hypothetical protein